MRMCSGFLANTDAPKWQHPYTNDMISADLVIGKVLAILAVGKRKTGALRALPLVLRAGVTPEVLAFSSWHAAASRQLVATQVVDTLLNRQKVVAKTLGTCLRVSLDHECVLLRSLQMCLLSSMNTFG